jgi:drug/metabolite transporter (DMT)-like permease
MLRKGRRQEPQTGDSSDKYKLIFGGTCLGLTSTFYYLSVQYLPVSVCIVLLMQTTWMGILVDCVRYRKRPGLNQVIAIVIILGGTLMATDLVADNISYIGCILGILAAISYTGAMYAANHVALHRPLFYRSKLLVCGGLLAIILCWNIQLIQGFNASVLWKYGLLLALFGTILPPVFFNKGFPLVGMGLGSVLAVVEIPVSIVTAHFLLQEEVSEVQVVGCVILVIGMVVPHLKKGTGIFVYKKIRL